MSTRSGASYTPRTSRRVQARRQAAEQSRARTNSLPPRPRAPGSIRDKNPTTARHGLQFAQGRPNMDPAAPQGPPDQGIRASTLEVGPQREADHTSGAEDRTRLRATSQSVTALAEDIRALQARSNGYDDKLEKVISEIQILRRDVNSLLEDPNRLPNVTAGAEATKLPRPERRNLQVQPGDADPDPSSFTKLSELVSRLERVERDRTPKRHTTGDRRRRSKDHQSKDHRHYRRNRGHSASSSDGPRRQHRDQSTDSSSSEDENTRRNRKIPSTRRAFRTRGRKHDNLKPLTATDPKFKEVLDYRYYRLSRSSRSRNLDRLRHHVKSMMVTLRRHIFDGRDPILILDFLRRYASECDAQGMSEPQAHCALEYFMDGQAADHFMAVNNSSSADEGGVSCWPEAVHYLLRSYATHDAIREASLRLTSIRQSTEEPEEEYSARLNNAAIRCGNVHSMDDKKTILVDGLITATKALVSRHREENPRASYLELVQFASVEGKTHRARAGVPPTKAMAMAKITTPKQGGNHPLLRSSKPALYAEMTAASDDLFAPPRRGDYDDNLHLLGEVPGTQGNPFSMDTSDASTARPSLSTASAQDTDPALYVTPHSRSRQGSLQTVRPQRLNFDADIARNRPGWQTPRQHAPAPPTNTGAAARIICHVCYVKNDHIAPDCPLPLKEQWQVLRNYSDLSQDEKQRVPTTSYYRARAQFAEDGTPMPKEDSRTPAATRETLRAADTRHPAVLQRARSPNHSGN